MNHQEEYQRWLRSGKLSPSQRQELLLMNEKQIEESFSAPLVFGTAGIRGIMGMGCSKMNIFVVCQATRAFLKVLLENKADSVCIGYDCRQNSRLFAEAAAIILAQAGMRVYFYSQARPTPLVSFAIRHFHLGGGICITASHNTKEYNGYKVFWKDGAQITAPLASLISVNREQTELLWRPDATFEEQIALGRVILLGEEMDALFIEQVRHACVHPDAFSFAPGFFSVTYTPFHGVAGSLMKQIFTQSGVQVHYVSRQMQPDGSFPTVKSPNPENPEGFALAVSLAQKTKSHLIIGNDPDGDRMSALARAGDGSYIVLTGNQVGALLTYYLLQNNHGLSGCPVLVKSIVTTDLARAIVEASGGKCVETFTGFKYMAKAVNQLPPNEPYILAFEEACGYMFGDAVRDKDGMTAALLLAEMGAWYHMQGKSMLSVLGELYSRFGYYAERTLSIPASQKNMARIMETLRASFIPSAGGFPVLWIGDYLSGVRRDKEDRTHPLPLQGEDVLQLTLAQGKIFIRPSGTEPKVKVYLLFHGENTLQTEQMLQSCSNWITETMQ